MKKVFLPFIYISLLLLVSCSSSKVRNNADSLTANQWDLVAVSGKVFDAGAVKSGIPFLMFSTGNGFTGNTGCNTFTGSYKLENGKLTLDPGAITKMFCADVPETEFLSALRQTTGYKITGSELLLLNGTTELMKLIPKK
ncbi:MAG: META domain-containing protein [Ignavibacteriota bacterium]